ncbi:MAG: RNA polymerase sigma-70 factor [Sphingobacteriia bacterium]|nr:RNA polymerase sigma-70 factor [Sphingobacteriia bacterium]
MPSHSEILVNEKELFAQMATGNEAAFTQIFYYYTQRIYQYIFTKTKSKTVTEEIVQEVFIKLWKKREDLSHIENHQSYIFSMAANKTYDWLKKMALEEKIRLHTWQTIQDFSNITEETLNLNESKELIDEAVEHLSPQRKKIFLLSREHGLSRAEIAEELNLSINTVNNHLNEALRLVKEHLNNNKSGITVTLITILLKIHQ